MSQPKRAKRNDLRGAILHVKHMHTGNGDINVFKGGSYFVIVSCLLLTYVFVYFMLNNIATFINLPHKAAYTD